MRNILMLIIFLALACFSVAEEKVEKKSLISGLKKTLIKKAAPLLSTEEELPPMHSPVGHDLVVDLRNPAYKNGILTTHEGGVIKNENIRIQARTMQYIRKTEKGKLIHRIEADGDLMLQYRGRVFVGDELEYDFVTKTGVVYEGKTFTKPWYLGGDRIELKSDGSYKVKNVFITTCENIDSSWDIHAGDVDVQKKDRLAARRVRFRFFKIPTIWLPSFKVNLKKFLSPPLIRYKVNWDKGCGPRGSVRYQLYSWRDFALFARLDYRLKRGFGGALETEYFPDHRRSSFITRSYLASDTLPKDPQKKRRYRLQGAYHSVSPSSRTTADLTWDKFSDIDMPGDFKSDDFEINTAKRSELQIRHQEEELIAILYAQPRLNTFATVKQEIPSLYVTLKPQRFDTLGVISYNWIKTSYMDFAYSHDLTPHLDDFHSFRMETHHELYRPFFIGPLTFNPKMKAVGIFYGSTLDSKSKGLGILGYGFILKTSIFRRFERYNHLVWPYILYDGYTKPTLNNKDHYIFSISDGWHKLNMLRLGIKNQFFSNLHKKGEPSFQADLYTNAFFAEDNIYKLFPKIYLDLEWNFPSIFILAKNGYNVARSTLDFFNIRMGWTVNENLAFKMEYRYRSKFDWRKANQEDFILDTSKSEDMLLSSPLSDRRSTFLMHAFFRLNPFWTCHFQSHHGWNRMNEPGYNEFKIDLFTMLSSSWKIRMSYQHSQRDDRITAAAYLIKK